MYCCPRRNPKELVEQDEQDQQNSQEKNNEKELLYKIKHGKFEEIENIIKPRALKYCKSNALVMGMKVNFELRSRAQDKGPDEKRFDELANSVEKFTTCFLDPLRYDESKRDEFGDSLEEILDDAIQLDQKKLFTHPVVDTEIKRKWYGDVWYHRMLRYDKSNWKSVWQVLFISWCLFDFVFFPILFVAFSLMQRKSNVQKSYLESLDIPVFKFVRDTLSYIALLVLHYALCLSPTTVTFSVLEWGILIFFIGRYLVERKQICDALQRLQRQGDTGTASKCIHLKALSLYQSDLWNKLDFISLFVYLVILILRVATFIMSGSAINNRVLAVAGYLYSANTLCLTFRVFGHILEQAKDVGTIQIALFSILKDISVVIWQFTAAILAFSIAITKVYMVEKSFVASGSDDIVCKKSGISCWWAIITYLGWSLLGTSEDFDPMNSADFPSERLARILYAGFLIMGVILLINMLIALLSNTYQRIEDNSLKEWLFKSAITVQTYNGYDQIPVPFNIIYSVAKLLRLVKKKKKEKGNALRFLIIDLDREYTAKYGNFLPVPDEKKDDLVVKETNGNRRMISQILNSTFKFQGGAEAWEAHTGIRIEGNFLTCEYVKHCPQCRRGRGHRPGARYLKRFSKKFPHFELIILETGKQIMTGIGVVNEGYDTSKMPGRKNGTVGYHTDGNIYDAENHYLGRPTQGPVGAFRGDRIRCTVLFGEEKEIEDGKKQVPICFTLNGRKIIIKAPRAAVKDDRVFMDYDDGKPLYPYIGMTDGSSVLAKMCSRENEEEEISKIGDLTKKVTKLEESLEETNRKLDILLARSTHQE